MYVYIKYFPTTVNPTKIKMIYLSLILYIYSSWSK